MEFKIEILSNKCLLGEKEVDLKPISRLFLRFNSKLKEVIFLGEEIDVNEISSPTIFVMPDDKIDEFVSNHKVFYEGKSEIVDGVAIMGGENYPVVVLPLESEIYSILEKVLEKIKENYSLKESKIIRLFGKKRDEVESILKENYIKADVYSDGLLVDLYINQTSSFVSDEEVKINELFNDFIYSQSDLSMRDVIARLLPLKHEKLYVLDSFTGGEIARDLLKTGSKDITTKTFNYQNEDGIIKTFDGIFKDEEALVNHLSLKSIQQHKGDVSVVTAYKNINNAYRVTIAIAKRDVVDLYNLWVEGSLEEAISLGKNWVIFNLIKKLKEKDFEN